MMLLPQNLKATCPLPASPSTLLLLPTLLAPFLFTTATTTNSTATMSNATLFVVGQFLVGFGQHGLVLLVDLVELGHQLFVRKFFGWWFQGILLLLPLLLGGFFGPGCLRPFLDCHLKMLIFNISRGFKLLWLTIGEYTKFSPVVYVGDPGFWSPVPRV